MSVDIWKLIHRHSGDTDEFQFDEEEHSTLDVTDSIVEFTTGQPTELVGGSTLGTLFGQLKGWINKLVHDIGRKQDTLTAGDNITISDNVISANVPQPVSSYNDLTNKPDINGHTLTGSKSGSDLGLQDKLVAGQNINIAGNVISSTAQGGTTNYADLTHKPKINNVELSGNKTTSDLHLDQVVEVTQDEYDAMEAAGTLDPAVAYFINDADPEPVFPEDGSEGDVLTSDGNGGVQWSDLGLGSAAQANVTDRLLPDSTDVPESRAVYNAIASTISGIFTPKGNIDFADLTSALLIPQNVGNVYETNDAGTTDSNWVQPAGTTIPAQSAVAIISADTIRFNYNGPAVFNLNDYQKKDLTATTQGANTVEEALTNLASQKAEQSALNATNQNVSQAQSDITNLQTNANKAYLGSICHLPYYRWQDVDPTHNTETYMKNLIDILENRSDIPKDSATFYWGTENPNNIVMVYGYTYNGSFKQYSAFHVLMYGEEYLCGYTNGNWYFKTITMT